MASQEPGQGLEAAPAPRRGSRPEPPRGPGPDPGPGPAPALDPRARYEAELAELAAEGQLRALLEAEGAQEPWLTLAGRRLLNLASNNYLGLAGAPQLREAAVAAVARYGCGATASRLIAGNHPLYAQLEEELAAWQGTEAALVFGSGYAANVGTLSALVGRDDLVLSDRLNHASIVDGIVLSRAEHRRYRHGDVEHLARLLAEAQGRYRTVLVVTDSVFSMDGDLAPLAEIAALTRRHGALLMVDEAHATGVFGPQGQGLAHALGVQELVDVHVGTLSKAVGAVGGFVAGRRSLIRYLVNRARSLIYSTALPPADVAAALAGVRLLRQAGAARAHLHRLARRFRRELRAAGLAVGPARAGDSGEGRGDGSGHGGGGRPAGDWAEDGMGALAEASPIVPVFAGSNQRALAFSRELQARGVGGVAIRPPTVPAGTARVRFSLTASLTEEDLAWAVAQIVAAARACGLATGTGDAP